MRHAVDSPGSLPDAAASPLVSRVLKQPHIEPRVSAVLRGRLVRESARFTLRELRGATSTHTYAIRASGLLVRIAHGTPDVLTLDQAFYQDVYEPPPEATSKLLSSGRPLQAIDMGANIGMWGLWLHGRFDVGGLKGLEPDPENAAKHRRQIHLNQLADSWEVVQAAATCADGPVRFTVGHGATGRLGEAEPDAVEVAGLDSFRLLDGIDLLKMDIEGAEWAILSDPRMAQVKVPVVMVEYHPHAAPSSDPETDARRALERAGYETRSMHGAPDGTGIVWGWKP